MSNPSFDYFRTKAKDTLDHELLLFINDLDILPQLKEAISYSLKAGGKRIRPLLLFSTMDAFGVDWKKGIQAAYAIEMVHTYSLIHDDLPCMDDDDLRRGLPTNHKVFGEAMAVLAGDALLTLSFDVLANIFDSSIDDKQKLELILGLTKAAGAQGMVGGQVADIEGENKHLTLQELEFIHSNKTGKLLAFSVDAGAILSNATQKEREILQQFSQSVGLAFQIRDDILDVEGEESILGKPIGSDKDNQKSTYPGLLTMHGAKKKLDSHIEDALYALEKLDRECTFLRSITELIAKRNH